MAAQCGALTGVHSVGRLDVASTTPARPSVTNASHHTTLSGLATRPCEKSGLKITPIRAFADNYIWCLTDDDSRQAAVVDPGDAAPVLAHLQAQNLSLAAILITHHHRDHTGGIARLSQAFPGIPVYGPANESIAGVTHPLGEGDTVRLEAPAASFRVMDVPGHTAGHIAYLGDNALFCGDTLFAGGCGRVFDGTMAQLAESLARIARLPAETLIYCAHEYTVDNLGFAKWVEPDNPAVLARDESALAMAEAGQPTVPSTLQLELDTNPFLRCEAESVRAAAQRRNPAAQTYAEVFAEIRRWKDSEYD